MFFAQIPGIHYREAKLTRGSVWFISFYCLDPFTGKLKRVRVKVNRIRNLRERRRKAENMVAAINQRLSMGWNPLADAGTMTNTATMSDCLDKFLKVKKKETEPATFRSYDSFVKTFRQYLQSAGFDRHSLIESFDRRHALAFMDLTEQKVGPKTYNNYLNFFRGLFIWMGEKGYCDGTRSKV